MFLGRVVAVFSMLRPTSVLLRSAAGVAALGLALAAAQAGQDDPVTADDLKIIGLAYHNHLDALRKAPAKAEDLAKFFDNNARVLKLLKSGKITFVYGVGLRDMPQGTSATVLAHEKEAAKKGGLVLFGDASVRRMSAEEFKGATIARPPGKGKDKGGKGSENR
jgi:hypothetical protein